MKRRLFNVLVELNVPNTQWAYQKPLAESADSKRSLVVLRYELYETVHDDPLGTGEIAVARAIRQLEGYAPKAFRFVNIHDLHTNEILVTAPQFAQIQSSSASGGSSSQT